MIFCICVLCFIESLLNENIIRSESLRSSDNIGDDSQLLLHLNGFCWTITLVSTGIFLTLLSRFTKKVGNSWSKNIHATLTVIGIAILIIVFRILK
jgi:hypothetical protein